MSTVFYQDALLSGDLPLLLFDYGVVEGGGPPDQKLFEHTIRDLLQEAGLGRYGTPLPRAKPAMKLDGTKGTVKWFKTDPDEYEELSPEWVEVVRRKGEFLAVYKNLMGESPILQDLLADGGTLVGVVQVEC